MWSLGVVLFVLATCEFPFGDQGNMYKYCERICKCRYIIPSCVDDCMKSWINMLLQHNPKLRHDTTWLLDETQQYFKNSQ